MDIFVNFLKVLQLVFCVLVVAGVLFSSQKSEGLSGIMGSSSYSARSAKGMDEGMRRTITWLGVGLIANSILLGIIGT
jgi:protein translocase SecG subunit